MSWLDTRGRTALLALAALVLSGASLPGAQGTPGPVPEALLKCMTEFLGVAPHSAVELEGQPAPSGRHSTDRQRVFSVDYAVDGHWYSCRLAVAGEPPYVASAAWLDAGPAVSAPWEEAATSFVEQRFPQWCSGARLRLLGQLNGRIAFGWQGEAPGGLSGASVGLSIDPESRSIRRYQARCARLDAPEPEITGAAAARIARSCGEATRPVPQGAPVSVSLVRSSPLAPSAGPVWMIVFALEPLSGADAGVVLVAVDAVDGAILLRRGLSP